MLLLVVADKSSAKTVKFDELIQVPVDAGLDNSHHMKSMPYVYEF